MTLEANPGGLEARITPGRAMALDLGEKRIGVALSDEAQMIARSFIVLRRSSRQADFARIGTIAQEQGVVLVVVGLPVQLDDREGSKAAWARDYAAALGRQLGLVAELWDESFSTADAEASLRQRGVHGKKRRRRVDAAAAAIILQSYLDARKESGY